jgi:DNA-binding transcriptional ArsR family regulator
VEPGNRRCLPRRRGGVPSGGLLRALGLVTGRRDGRHVVHSLYDDHVAQLLGQAVHHIEHLRLGVRDTG